MLPTPACSVLETSSLFWDEEEGGQDFVASSALI